MSKSFDNNFGLLPDSQLLSSENVYTYIRVKVRVRELIWGLKFTCHTDVLFVRWKIDRDLASSRMS